jgi:hypothetical protein
MDLSFGFESFGTRILFKVNDEEFLQNAVSVSRTVLLDQVRPHGGPYDTVFELQKIGSDRYAMSRNGEIVTEGSPLEHFARLMDDLVRIAVAEFSRKYLFVHAGAVGWRGKGILLPAMSFKGKSSFVTELVKAGADYYSDDFALLDQKGLLRPFARKISMRERNGGPGAYEIDAREELRAKIGTEPIPVGLILLTEYRPHARWRPRVLSIGEGVLATLPYAISLTRDPARSMRVLNIIGVNGTIAETPRPDAKLAAQRLLTFMDELSV